MSFSYRSGTKSNFSSKAAPANKKVVADDMNDIADELNRLDLIVNNLINNSGVADELSGLATAANNTYYGKDRDGLNSGFLRTRDLGVFNTITQRDNYSSPQQGDICTVSTQASSLFVYDGSSWIRLSPLDGTEIYNELTNVLGGTYWVTAGTSYLGDYADLTALQTAHPTGQSDEYALVGTAGNRTFYVWDGSNWVDSTEGPNGLYMTKAEYATNGTTGVVDKSVDLLPPFNPTGQIPDGYWGHIYTIGIGGTTQWSNIISLITDMLGHDRWKDYRAAITSFNEVDISTALRLIFATTAQLANPSEVQNGNRIAAIDPNTGEIIPRVINFPTVSSLDIYATYGSYADYDADRANIPDGSVIEIWTGSEFVFRRTGTSPGTRYQVNITATNGSVTKSPDQVDYSLGSVVTLTPNPNTGYVFSQWGDGSNANPRTVTVNGTINLTAVFSIASLTASFDVATSSMGAVEINWLGTGSPVRADIDWGDGSPVEIISNGTNPTSPSPSHSYSMGGTYTITFTLTDIDGNSATSFETVEIAPFN